MDLTYVEVCGTRGDLPPEGYRHVLRHERLGAGQAVFRTAANALGRWDMHRAAGFAVRAPDGPAAVRGRMSAGVGIGPLRVWAPCEVVWLFDQPRFYAFGCGTLTGHPVSGEEAFELRLDDDDQVWFDIRAFSRPATWYARWGGRLGEGLQDRITDRYVRALRGLANMYIGG